MAVKVLRHPGRLEVKVGLLGQLDPLLSKVMLHKSVQVTFFGFFFKGGSSVTMKLERHTSHVCDVTTFLVTLLTANKAWLI